MESRPGLPHFVQKELPISFRHLGLRSHSCNVASSHSHLRTVNLVQLTVLFHTEHTLSQEGPGWEGHRGAKPGNSRESRAFSQKVVSGTNVCSRQVLRSAKKLSWGSPGRGYPAEAWILPLAARQREQAPLSLASPLLPMRSLAMGWSSAAPNYVISLMEPGGTR